MNAPVAADLHTNDSSNGAAGASTTLSMAPFFCRSDLPKMALPSEFDAFRKQVLGEFKRVSDAILLATKPLLSNYPNDLFALELILSEACPNGIVNGTLGLHGNDEDRFRFSATPLDGTEPKGFHTTIAKAIEGNYSLEVTVEIVNGTLKITMRQDQPFPDFEAKVEGAQEKRRRTGDDDDVVDGKNPNGRGISILVGICDRLYRQAEKTFVFERRLDMNNGVAVGVTVTPTGLLEQAALEMTRAGDPAVATGARLRAAITASDQLAAAIRLLVDRLSCDRCMSPTSISAFTFATPLERLILSAIATAPIIGNKQTGLTTSEIVRIVKPVTTELVTENRIIELCESLSQTGLIVSESSSNNGSDGKHSTWVPRPNLLVFHECGLLEPGLDTNGQASQ